MDERLVRAKKYIAVAESKDAKREAYKAATNEIAAYKAETGASNAAIAIALGRVKDTNDPKARRTGADYVAKLLKWRDSGFKDATPFTEGGEMSGRVAVSHTKRTLRERPVEEIKEMLDDLPDEAVEKVAQATEGTKITRKLYADRVKPTVKDAKRKVKADDTERLKKQPYEAYARVGSAIGSVRASTRALLNLYQDFLALVDDEEFRGDLRDRLVELRADLDLALGEVLEGSIDAAFTRLLEEEVK